MGTAANHARIVDEIKSLGRLSTAEKESLLFLVAASGVFEEDTQDGWIDMGTTRAGELVHLRCRSAASRVRR